MDQGQILHDLWGAGEGHSVAEGTISNPTATLSQPEASLLQSGFQGRP